MAVKFWPWSRPEVRHSYTDQIIAQLLASATGASDGGALAAIETAARWWGSGLASATIKPSEIELAAITPSVLDTIGRSLCRSGESLHIIDVRAGRVTLTPVSLWEVHGSEDPATWTYRCTVSGPDVTRLVTLPSASVLHFKYAAHPARPWAGRSPMALAVDTARAAGLLEHATSEEFSFVQRQLLSPRRNQGDYGMVDSLTPELIAKVVKSFSDHTGSGAMIVPGDLEPKRLGPEPPDSFALLRDRFEQSIYSSCGIPPALLAPQGTGTAMREAFRQVLHSLLKPLGSLVVEEIREKLHPEAALDFSAMRAGDISGSARALGSLVTAGLTPKSAAQIVGFDDVEVSAP